jgi:glutathione S-transferase
MPAEAPMKLYYSPGSCALASHIVLEEGGLPYSTVRVNLANKTTESGVDYNTINPKGYVPLVVLDNGQSIGENTALLAYLGEQSTRAKLMPAAGTMENYRVREWLGFVSSELHKNCSPLFRPDTPEATAKFQREILAKRLALVNEALAGKSGLTGEQFTPADAYLFVVLNWMGRLKIDLAPFPHLVAFHARVAARPAVQKAMKDEGLLKAA